MVRMLVSSLLILIFSCPPSQPFTTNSPIISRHKSPIPLFASINNNNAVPNNNNNNLQTKLLRNLFSPQLIPLTLQGIGTIQNTTCLFLSPKSAKYSSEAIALPISPQTLPLLLATYENQQPLSKTKCLSLNSLLINRDNALFDALPWSTWTEESKYRDLDAAGNLIDSKYHMGKRDAYNRFRGKDWPGWSLSVGNLAQRALLVLEQEEEDEKKDLDSFDENSAKVLAKRVLELELREAKSSLAEAEYELAIATADSAADENIHDVRQKQNTVNECRQAIQTIEEKLYLLNDNSAESQSFVNDFLRDVRQSYNQNPSPYRGAYGFDPKFDSPDDMFQKSVFPYKGPYDLLKSILLEQLRADVIGTVLEDTWIGGDEIVLGGAVVLQRRKKKGKTVMMEGELVEVPVEEKDERIPEGEVEVVECEGDEAIGMALACGMNVLVEKDIWEKIKVVVEETEQEDGTSQKLPQISVLEQESEILLSSQVDQQQQNDDTSSINFLSNLPKTTSAFLQPSSSSNNNGNKNESSITSLQMFDSLSMFQKAKILQSLNQPLPRPRTIRNAKTTKEKSSSNPLDKLLLPFVDESVRRQYRIREAERRGDVETVQTLQRQKSKRQIARERAEMESSEGNDEMSERYEDEATFWKDLRADVTQDEGTYNRFLDKDEWYERERLKNVRRLDKKKFGTLLDGIE